MDNKTKKKSLFSDRKFKYGSLAVGLTVAFIALVIIFNAVVYALAYSYGWYIDLTGERYYGITDKSKKYLDEVLTDDVQIKIIFCRDKDRVLDDSAGYYVYKCVESYMDAYPKNIKVEYLDVVSHPDLAEIYTSQLGIGLRTDNVIIESNQSESFRLVTYENFYTFDADTGDIYAFNGERRITSYIISLCTDYPICYFTTGHGESIYDADGEPNPLYNLMIDAGFDVRTIDLSKENLDGNAKVVIVNNPIYDFKGADHEVNEIEKLGKFMSDNGGNMMVFLSPENQGNLVIFKQWLAEWGIGIEAGQVRDDSHSLTVDGLSIVGNYTTDDDGFAASLHSSLRQMDSQPSTIVRNAVAFERVFEAQGSREVGVVLNSYPTSKLYTTNGDFSGVYPLALLARQTKIDTLTQSQMRTYMFVSAAGFCEQQYIDTNAYGNRDIINYLVSQMGKTLVPMDIDFKVFASEALDITTANAYTWTVVLVAVIPLAVCTLGGVVCYKRKRL